MLRLARRVIDRLEPDLLARQVRTRLRGPKPTTIYFLSTRQHQYTIRWHLQHWGASLVGLVVPMSYDELFARVGDPAWWDSLHESAWGDRARLRSIRHRLGPGVYIFADLERLSHTDTRRASLCWQLLARLGPAVKLLNHPARTLRRYELLRTLYERGINPFNVYRLTEARYPVRYPVFVRDEGGHAGPRPTLLYSHRALDRMIRTIEQQGIDRHDVLIEEYIETGDHQGCYRSYGALKVGDRIYPGGLLVAPSWVVKRADVRTDETMRESDRFTLEGKPFPVEHVRKVFRLARVDYGRMDFAFYQGRPVTWEINTNPTLSLPPEINLPGSEYRRWVSSQRFEAALRALVSN